jgi:hypothetical protein
VGIGAGKEQADAPGVAQNHRADLEQLEPDGLHLGPRQFGAGESESADGFHQPIGAGGKQKPELVGPPVVATGAVGEQPELLFLDPVFHFAARAVDLVVEGLCVAGKVGDDEARVAALGGVLGLGDDPALFIPTARRVIEIGEEPDFFLGALMLGFGLRHQQLEHRLEPRVFGQPDDVLHAVALAPAQHLPAAKAGVPAKDDLHSGPRLAQPLHQQL